MSVFRTKHTAVTRRAWMRTTAAGLSGWAAGCNVFDGFRLTEPPSTAAHPATPTAPVRPRPVIDAHVHLFAEDEVRFPFHANAPYRPQYRAPVERFLEHMNAAGIQGAVLVHAEPYQDDHRYTLHCLATAPKRLRATCLFDPNAPDTPERLARLCENPGFVALRIHAFRDDRLPVFASTLLDEIWQTAHEHGLAIQLHGIPKHLLKFVHLVQRHADTTVIIDHLGRPGQGTPDENQAVLRLAAMPNVYMKFSGLSHASKQPFPHADIRPFLERVVDAFGPERMLWGDSYRGEPYGQAARAVDRVLDFLDEPARAMIAGGTAARLFRTAM